MDELILIETNKLWDIGKQVEKVEHELYDLIPEILSVEKMVSDSSFLNSYTPGVQRLKINTNSVGKRVGRLASYFFRVAEIYELNELTLKSYIDSIVGSGEKASLPPSGSEIIGNPYRIATYLDDYQGDNKYKWGGDCGMVSIANMLVYLGFNVSEDDITWVAKNAFNMNYEGYKPEHRGSTDPDVQKTIIEAIRFESGTSFSAEIKSPKNEGSYEDIARYLEEGKAVKMGLSSAELWGEKRKVEIDHAIVITGVVRDKESKQIVGFYICDSGSRRSDSCRYVSADTMDKCYKNIGGNLVVVTKH